MEKPTIPYGQVGKITNKGKDSYRELARCSLFSTGVIHLKEKFGLESNDSFVSLVVLEGKAEMRYKGGKMEISKGDSIFIPAGMNVNLVGEAEILSSYV